MNDKQNGRWAMTGAAGTIGRHLRATLADGFDELVVMDVDPVAPLAPHEREVRVDLRDLAAVTVALEGVEGVIHLGGLADEADFHDLADVNIVGTFHLLEAARLVGARRVVYASSNRATGFYPTEHIVRPDEPFRPDGLYGVTKASAEALCRLYVDKFGLQVACLRIGSFQQIPTTPRELHTWLSPADCTAAFTAALRAEYDFTTFYAVSANTDRWWDLAAGVAIGFEPEDDGATFAADLPGQPVEPQGGVFATQEFTLSRQKHV